MNDCGNGMELALGQVQDVMVTTIALESHEPARLQVNEGVQTGPFIHDNTKPLL
jgi:hypothetical protein